MDALMPFLNKHVGDVPLPRLLLRRTDIVQPHSCIVHPDPSAIDSSSNNDYLRPSVLAPRAHLARLAPRKFGSGKLVPAPEFGWSKKDVLIACVLADYVTGEPATNVVSSGSEAQKFASHMHKTVFLRRLTLQYDKALRHAATDAESIETMRIALTKSVRFAAIVHFLVK